jgi:hypothetical protein
MQTKFNTLTKKSVQGKTRLLVILLLLAGLSSVVFFNQISSNYARKITGANGSQTATRSRKIASASG